MENNSFCDTFYDHLTRSFGNQAKYDIQLDDDSFCVTVYEGNAKNSISNFCEHIEPLLVSQSIKRAEITLNDNDLCYQIEVQKNKICNDTGDIKGSYIVIKLFSTVKKVSIYKKGECIILYNDNERNDGKKIRKWLDRTIRCTYIIHENKTIMIGKSETKYYPCTAKNIGWLPIEVQELIFSLYADGSLFYKDMIRDNFYPPVPLTEIKNYHSKKDYLEKIFGITLSKKINRYPFSCLYAACCSAKYVKEEQAPKLFQFDDLPKGMLEMGFVPSIRNRKDIAKRYIIQYIQNKRKNISEDYLIDYIGFAFRLNEKIDITAGKKRITNLHDECSERILKRANHGKKLIIPETPLKYLNLPKEFVLLKTKKALMAEGMINHNCVGTYLDKVNQGKCVIYTADINEEHLTIEITYNRRKFNVSQCYKKYNKACKDETYDYVVMSVNEASPQALERYKKAVKRKGETNET